MSWRGVRRLLVLGLMLPLVSGCWNQRPIEQRAIVMAVGVTAHHQWQFLFPNVAVTADSLTAIPSAQQFYTVTVQAPTWQQAVQRVQVAMDRKVSVGELQLLIVDQHLSTGQVTRIVDSLQTTGAVPATFWIAASPGSPTVLLESTSPQTVVPYYYVTSYFDCRHCHPLRLGAHGWQWWARNATPGDSPYLPLTQRRAGGVTVRHVVVYPLHGRPVLMPPSVTEGFAYLTNRAVDVAVPVSVDDQAYTVARLHTHARTRVRLTPRAVAVQVQIRTSGIIEDVPPHTVVTRALEQRVGLAAARVIAARAQAAIAWANRTHTDPFGYAKRAAWLDDTLGATFSPTRLTTLPIHAQIAVQVTIHGEGVAR
ncbi:spore gernimation protein [Sulfobacillus harzensis]|uniref:Spore gernimation protein n=1 Tax=Sulfobacillus harzensis TaxID=2729629 RepID=A0A7Y0L837_9FIRM|nr:spore gernimation protein [Sulfobacillus harzensis]NMP25058.1 spore gernimation protein [Sulfobacillus harzensis]